MYSEEIRAHPWWDKGRHSAAGFMAFIVASTLLDQIINAEGFIKFETRNVLLQTWRRKTLLNSSVPGLYVQFMEVLSHLTPISPTRDLLNLHSRKYKRIMNICGQSSFG